MGINQEEYILGAADLEDGTSSEAATYFVQQHNEAFKHKVAALGPEESVPCYVQSSVGRDMLSQFLDPITRHGTGLEKQNDTYLWDGSPIQLPEANAQVAEILALKQGAKKICEELHIEHIQYRACITGPFEMASRLWRGMGVGPRYDEKLIETFAVLVQAFMKNAQIHTKYLKPLIITLDEPSIGVTGVGDLFTDSESDPKLTHLIKTWNPILSAIHSNCYRGLHLHASPYHQLANAKWNLLEAHLGVIVNKSWLHDNDKYIRAAIMRTDGPTIPQDKDLRAAWDQIQSGNYQSYLQPLDELHHYLKAAVDRYGGDRIPFAGPECGLGSWDWKFGDTMALANLQNVRQIITEFNTRTHES
jgi:5-methyltetrahydropteroyltriglutamate--homocysteine methyltransferase